MARINVRGEQTMTTIETLEEKLRALTTERLQEVEDFVEFLLEKQRKVAASPESRGWPPGYFEEVIGSLPDFPDVDGDMGGVR
jgi:hypothetical protein